MKSLLKVLFSLALLAASGLALARVDDSREEALERARKELSQAREELRRAAVELARITREMDPESSRARAFEMVANPKRAVLGVGIAVGPEKKGEIRGVLITAVTPGSGADKAGLKSGDLLLSANGTNLVTPAGAKPGPERRLRDLMGELSAGDKVELVYERDGKSAKTTVIVQRPDNLELSVADFDDHPGRDVLVARLPLVTAFTDERFGGLRLARLDDDLASYFQTRDGVLVVRAPKDAPIGLKSGDVIRKIDGKAIDSPIEAMERLRGAGDDDVSIDVVRHGKPQSLKGKWEESDWSRQRRIDLHKEP